MIQSGMLGPRNTLGIGVLVCLCAALFCFFGPRQHPPTRSNASLQGYVDNILGTDLKLHLMIHFRTPCDPKRDHEHLAVLFWILERGAVPSL